MVGAGKCCHRPQCLLRTFNKSWLCFVVVWVLVIRGDGCLFVWNVSCCVCMTGLRAVKKKWEKKVRLQETFFCLGAPKNGTVESSFSLPSELPVERRKHKLKRERDHRVDSIDDPVTHSHNSNYHYYYLYSVHWTNERTITKHNHQNMTSNNNKDDHKEQLTFEIVQHGFYGVHPADVSVRCLTTYVVTTIIFSTWWWPLSWIVWQLSDARSFCFFAYFSRVVTQWHTLCDTQQW